MRADSRAHQVNRECCSPYYGVLVKTDKEEQKASFQALLAGLRAFSTELEKTPGPTFLAHGQLSAADISLLPWAYRYYVFEHYRGKSGTRERPASAATALPMHAAVAPPPPPPHRRRRGAKARCNRPITNRPQDQTL